MAKRRRKQSGYIAAINVREAINKGREAARTAIENRDRRQRRRAAAERAMPSRRRALAAREVSPTIPAKTRALLGPRSSAGVLIAEGDSWFDYPFHDILKLLEDEHLFEVESVAHKGDSIEDMAHAPGQFDEFARRLEKLLRDGKVPRAILLSGGGNDIAGDEFGMLLNHATSSLPPLNEDVVHGVIHVRVQEAYIRIISGITEIARSYLNRPIPIITHGYDYAVPDGRGFLGGWWLLPGPWLQPGFQQKGHADLAKNTEVVEQLIDHFNEVLAGIVSMPQFSHVHYLNLRNILRHDASYKTDWANELHPTERGFRLVTEKFATAIDSV